eukprot:2915558-Prymnesium_polylepis.1
MDAVRDASKGRAVCGCASGGALEGPVAPRVQSAVRRGGSEGEAAMEAARRGSAATRRDTAGRARRLGSPLLLL